MVRTKDERCPVTVDEIRLWNYIEDGIFDIKLRLCIESAITAVENYINQVVWPSTYVFEYPGVPACVELSPYPITSISVSVDGVELSPDLYAWDGIVLSIDGSVKGESTTVTVHAGNVPVDQDIKAAILLIASELFRNPTDSVKQLPTTSKLLLDPHRYANV